MENGTILTLPVIPVRNVVLFPYLLMPLSVGRPASVAAVEAAVAHGNRVFVVTQKDPSVDEPRKEDLYSIGSVAIIKEAARREDGSLALVALGAERAQLLSLKTQDNHVQGEIRLAPVPPDEGTEVEALHRAVQELAATMLNLAQGKAPAALAQLLAVQKDALQLAYFLGSMLDLDTAKAQALLEAPTRKELLRLVHTYLSHEVQVLELRNKIAVEAQSEVSREQRRYLLRQQLRVIQQELGEQDGEQAEAAQLRERIANADLPEEVRKEAERELSRMEKMPQSAPDYHVIRTYLDLVLDLPWRNSSGGDIDLTRAWEVLEEDHYGLREIKERICEHLAVLKLNARAKAPILCFVGPPGVGKTSLGQSIARAMDRKFERMSLGGLHDEAELRGHRRTYVGAMPGRIIQAIRRAGVNNPVLMLDEVDKLGRDFRGDPAAALLEILDPEQNRMFRDNYLDLPFDLSNVLFLVTANTTETIPQPLLDRMELLMLPGYSEEEKIQIATRYLIGRQLREAGLTTEQLAITEEALERVIRRYTREAGVRQLERAIGRLARKVAVRVAKGDSTPVTVHPGVLAEMLGPERFLVEEARRELSPGVATGLAWTEAGGDVLYVESTLLPDAKQLILTGHLGQVMQESARAARSYVWAHCEQLGIDKSRFKKFGVHIHVPAGAVSKDGPSAGVTMVTALASLYSERPVRSDTAMSGEITLSGLVLPVGGIKEKVLAARRAGIARVILPKANEKDLRELPDHVTNTMEFVLVDRIEQVLEAAFEAPKQQSFAVAA